MSWLPLSIFQCNSCHQKFELFLYSFNPDYGVLKCRCSEYPIVYSIPVFNAKQIRGETVRLIRDRKLKKALQNCLLFFTDGRGIGELLNIFKPKKVDRITESVVISFKESLKLLVPDNSDYYFHQSSSLQFLFSLLVSCIVPNTNGFFLSLRSGTGHAERQLANKLNSRKIISIDCRFHLLYLARRYMLPSCNFICCDEGSELFFSDGCFDNVLVMDNLINFNVGPQLVKELRRVTHRDSAVIAYDQIGSKLFSDFIDVLKDRSIGLFPLGTLTKDFISNHFVDLSKPLPANSQLNEPAMLFAGPAESIFTTYKDTFAADLRRLQVNPIYTVQDEQDILKLSRLPNLPAGIPDVLVKGSGCLPDYVEVRKDIVKALHANVADKAMIDLIFKLVFVDLPFDYV